MRREKFSETEAMEESEKSTVRGAEEKAKEVAMGGGRLRDRDDAKGGEIGEDEEITPAVAGKPTKSLATIHPLEHSWTFWFDNPSAKSKQAAWGSNIRHVYTFHSVEEFWGVYNNIHHPSKLGAGADFHCFKDKIQPKWEDPICANGGKWTVTFPKGKSDTPWLYTVLAMIGEQFDHGEEICGAVVNVRGRQEKISIWTKNAANEAAQMSIGQQWKKFLDYNDSIGFIFHDDAKKHDRSARNRYTC